MSLGSLFSAHSACLTAPGGAASDAAAAIAWSGWWRANYTGAPWTPTSSAGTSASGGNLVAPIAALTTGTAQGGYTPAKSDGATQYLRTANDISAFVGASAGTVSVLVKTPATAAAPAAAVIDDPCIMSLQGAGYIGMGWNNLGVRFYAYDGVYKSIQIACSTSAYHLLQMKWNGTTLYARVDSGAWQPLAVGALTGISGLLQIASNYANAHWVACDGYLEVALANAVISDASCDTYKTAINTRYGLAL